MLKHLIPSKTRRKILKIFFLNSNENFYLRKIVRDINEEVNAVKRELDILYSAKLLKRERRLNKVFYRLNKNWIYYNEFLKIIAKGSYFVKPFLKNISKLGKIKYIVISDKLIKKIPIKENEIYILIVGIIVVPEVSGIINQIEKQFGQEINYTVMTEKEFSFRKKNNDPFIWRFLRQSKIMLGGSEDDLMK